MLHRSWDTGEETFYLEKNVNIVGAEKWSSLQQFNVEEPHAIFEYDEEQRCFWVRDLSADSGMRVNGIPLSKTQSAKLKNGDKISLGYSPDYLFTFTPGHQPRVGGRHNGYQNDYGIQMLPKLNRGRAPSPRTLPSTAVLVEPELPYQKRSPTLNAYRRRVFRAGSFDAPIIGQNHKVITNTWVADKVHHGSVSSPSHSGSWDGMIEKKSPRSRGAFVNTQQSQLIREMQNKISHLESMLQQDQTTKSHQHHLVEDANKTVELAQQILELRSHLNKKDEEIRLLKDKSEIDHEAISAKNELIKLKTALAKSEKVRSRLESELDDKVDTLTYDSHGHLKFHGKKLHDRDDDHGLDSARSLDSVSTVNHLLNDSHGTFLNDSNATLDLFHDKKFRHDNLEGKVVDQKIQMKLYEAKIAELEKKLRQTLDGIDMTEKHYYKNTLETIDYNKNMSTLEEEKQILQKEKEKYELELEISVIFMNKILQSFDEMLNMATEQRDKIFNDKDYFDQFDERNKDDIKQFLKNSHYVSDDMELNDILNDIWKKLEQSFKLAAAILKEFALYIATANGNQNDQKLFEMKGNVLKKLLEIIKEDMEDKMLKIQQNPTLLEDNYFSSIPNKMNEYSNKLSDALDFSEWKNGEQADIIDWAHGQVSDLYNVAHELCPLIVQSVTVVHDDSKRQEALQNFRRNLMQNLKTNANIAEFHDIVLDSLNMSNIDGHQIHDDMKELIVSLSDQFKQTQLAKASDKSENTDLSQNLIDELHLKIEESKTAEETFAKRIEELEAEIMDSKDKLQQTQNNFKAILEQREEYAKVAMEQSQKYISNLEKQIKILEMEKQNSEVNSKPNTEIESSLNELKNENKSLTSIIDRLKETLSSNEQEKANLSKQIEHLESRLQQVPSNAEDELSELKSKLQALENGSNSGSSSHMVNGHYGNDIKNLQQNLYEEEQKARRHIEKAVGEKTNESISKHLQQNEPAHRNGFFDGPFQDAEDHLNTSHSSLLNSFRRSNERRTDDSGDNDMFWSLSQRLATMLDLDLKKHDVVSNAKQPVGGEIQLDDQMNAAQEIAGRVEELLQRIRQQNEELTSAREPQKLVSHSNQEERTSLINGTSENQSKLQGRITSAKADKRKKQEMPVKVVTFQLPDK